MNLAGCGLLKKTIALSERTDHDIVGCFVSTRFCETPMCPSLAFCRADTWTANAHQFVTGWWLTYPSEKWWGESQLGWLFHSQYDGKVIIQPCSSHHQPGTNLLVNRNSNPPERPKPLEKTKTSRPLAVWNCENTGWWCNNHLEKYESQWEGWHPIYDGKKKMFESTNQIMIVF